MSSTSTTAATGAAANRNGHAAHPAHPPHRYTRDQIEQRVRALGKWFHNLDLAGVRTAPDHFLGDYPAVKFRTFAHLFPADLRGRSVLDIGCNGGFYSIEAKKRGADRVMAVDYDDVYLNQAKFAAEVSGFPDIEFRKLSVYDVADVGEKFDLVIFMGVLYHLRHPLLALDLIREHVVKPDGLMLFQSMQRGTQDVDELKPDYDFNEQDHFESPGYPKLFFIEHKYSNDETNWWAPNRACADAMLRSSGFEIVQGPVDEVYLCKAVEVAPHPSGPHAVYPSKGKP
jgi:tRNA (mo5U34)-methyltransferase